MRNTLPRLARFAGAVFCLLAVPLAACRTASIRRAPESKGASAGTVFQVQWRRVVHEHGLFEPRPEECSTGVVVGKALIQGSRGKKIVALDTATGRMLWSTPIKGGIDAEAVYDAKHDQVIVGSDDGTVYALDPTGGKIRWTFQAQGAVDEAVHLAGDRVYIGSAADRIYALDARTGAHVWEYDRERPEGFTVHGYAAPLPQGNRVYAGFSDGFLVELDESGNVTWARSLAASADSFVDVDTTPLVVDDRVVAASFSGGLYGLKRSTGETLWRLPVEGAGGLRMLGSKAFFVAPTGGIQAVDVAAGHVLWRHPVINGGDLSPPAMLGPYVMVSASRSGVHILDEHDGTRQQVFDPGRGVCAAVAVEPAAQRIFVLSNGGSVYALKRVR